MNPVPPTQASPTPSKPITEPLPENLRGKKVVLINHSDTLGGAAVVTFRLLQALRREGVDARMVVFTKTSEEPHVSFVSTRFLRGAAFCLERLSILCRNGFNYADLFKVSTGSFARNVHHHPWVKEADVVCLNWINQGLMSLNGIRKLHRMGKKIVWTLHDMWPMTGICHHSYGCDRYKAECGDCPYLHSAASPDDLSHRVWAKKRELYSEVPIRFVTVSHWLQQLSQASSLMGNQNVTTIYNPFPTDLFHTHPRGDVMKQIITLEKPNILLFGAARLDDPIKGLDYTIDALNHIFDNYPEIASKTCIYFFGAIRTPELLDRLRFSHLKLGRVNDPQILRYLYSKAKVVISTSLYESLAGTLIEGQAGGAIPVTFGRDGRTDIVEHLKTGYIARYKDPVDIANGIIWALDSKIDRDALHRSVKERFDAPVIARQYISLFSDMLKNG